MKEKYPKSWEKLREFFSEHLKKLQKEFIKNSGVDVKDVEIPEVKRIEDVDLIGILAYNKRSMYDFFDGQSVYIGIDHRLEGFSFNVNGISNGTFYTSRSQGEEIVFEDALKVLEEKL